VDLLRTNRSTNRPTNQTTDIRSDRPQLDLSKMAESSPDPPMACILLLQLYLLRRCLYCAVLLLMDCWISKNIMIILCCSLQEHNGKCLLVADASAHQQQPAWWWGGGSFASAWRQRRQHNQQSTKSFGSYGNRNCNNESNDNSNKIKGNGGSVGSLVAAQRAVRWHCGCGGSFTSAQGGSTAVRRWWPKDVVGLLLGNSKNNIF
jgi:hypothetical protein